MIYEQSFVTKKAIKNVLFRVNSSVFRKGRVLEHRLNKQFNYFKDYTIRFRYDLLNIYFESSWNLPVSLNRIIISLKKFNISSSSNRKGTNGIIYSFPVH